MNTDRTETKGEKFDTQFGSMFAHVDFLDGVPVKVHVSAPQKLEDTEIWFFTERLLEIFNALIKDVRAQH